MLAAEALNATVARAKVEKHNLNPPQKYGILRHATGRTSNRTLSLEDPLEDLVLRRGGGGEGVVNHRRASPALPSTWNTENTRGMRILGH